MTTADRRRDPFGEWVDALEARHLAQLSIPEVGRALRALSSCYVERRARLPEGAALSGAGKRAAFALFYAPVHFFIVRHIIRALPAVEVAAIEDLGCGTGAAGAAWALESPGAVVHGIDRHPWAVAEANWTYRQLGVRGHARQGDFTRTHLRTRPGGGVVAAWALNEVPDASRAGVLETLLAARSDGAAVLVVEPIARRVSPWWQEWSRAFEDAGGRADEWRITAALPPRQRQLASAAGLRPDELTARSLFAGPAAGITRPRRPPRDRNPRRPAA